MTWVCPEDCTGFCANGNGGPPPLSADVTETLNGEYELTAVHPTDGKSGSQEPDCGPARTYR